jgi:hypothetical protein
MLNNPEQRSSSIFDFYFDLVASMDTEIIDIFIFCQFERVVLEIFQVTVHFLRT